MERPQEQPCGLLFSGLCSQPEQLVETLLVEPTHIILSDHNDGYTTKSAGDLHGLGHVLRVAHDIFGVELDALRRKVILGRLAGGSGRGGIDRYLRLGHVI